MSKKLNGRNVKWFPNGESLATTIAESVEISIYGIAPSSAPAESIPGGFGYGTLFVVGGRGNQGYGYAYAIYNGSNATGSRISAIYDKGSGWNEYAQKSDLASVDITPTPISGLAFAPATMFKKAGVAYLNLQISNTTSSAISMENGKVIATGFPIPYKKQQVYVEAIPWNNGATGSNASTTPLRLCINNTGQLCSYYPSANEKITPGMPICINMAYPINE